MRQAALRMVVLAVPEDIAHTSEGSDEGSSALGVDFAAKPVDVDVDDIGVWLDAHAPDLIEDHGAGDDAAGVAAEIFEQDEFLRGEGEGLAGAGGLAAEEVELEIEDAEAGGLGWRGGFPPEQIAQAGEQLGHGERLGEVIVATLLEAADAVVDGAAGGEDEDGGVDAELTEPEDESDAVLVGQPEIDDENVVLVFGGEALASLGVAGDIDLIAGLGERAFQKSLDFYLVFDQQEAHGLMVLHFVKSSSYREQVAGLPFPYREG